MRETPARLTVKRWPGIGEIRTVLAIGEDVYSLYAHMMGIQLESVTVDLKGQLDIRSLFGIDESVPSRNQKLPFETRITSSADAYEIEKLIRIVESRCPTLDTLRRPVDVSGSVFLNCEPIDLA